MIQVTILGSGTSQGVPIIGCDCSVCRSCDKRDKRLRSSVMVELDGKRLIIDSGPDFRYQMLRENIKHIDAILYTHYHKDHIGGLDDVRALNYVMQRPIDIYAEQKCIAVIEKDFDYAFAERKYPGVPELIVNTITTYKFVVGSIEITPIRGFHYLMPVLGFRIGGFAYITDMNRIEDDQIEILRGVDTLIINALRHEKHLSHFSLDEALEIIKSIGAKNSYLTHISHQMGCYEDFTKRLPKGVYSAYDGLKLNIE